MKDLILLGALLLTPVAVSATPTDPRDSQPAGAALCELLDYELIAAVEWELLTHKEAADISFRCWSKLQ